MYKLLLKKIKNPYSYSLILCGIFFILYCLLGIIRHNYYGSFGADLGFIDREIWQYSNFNFSQLIGQGHIEITSLLLTPLYWLWADARTLIVVQSLVVTTSGMAIFLLAKKYKLNLFLCYAVLLSYLLFYGTQSALWFDVHTSVWGAAFFMWFIYFLDTDRKKLTLTFFLLAIGSKENMAAYVFLFSGVYYVMTRKKEALIYTLGAGFYLFLLFKVIFPATLPKGYTYASSSGLVSGNPLQLIDTITKQKTIFYTFASVGFIPFLLPLYVIPVFGNLASYFILGREYVAAHDTFMHYRVDLLPLIFGSLVFTLARYKWLNNRYIAVYLIVCALFCQYALHLPLSYLSKRWFWIEPSGVTSINNVIKDIPETASLVAQNNIYPHVSQREDISMLWPDERTFKNNSPCSKKNCPWFRWTNQPEFLIIDLSPEWDIRHLLWQNEEFKMAVSGLEKEGIITKYKQENTTILYKVLKKAK